MHAISRLVWGSTCRDQYNKLLACFAGQAVFDKVLDGLQHGDISTAGHGLSGALRRLVVDSGMHVHCPRLLQRTCAHLQPIGKFALTGTTAASDGRTSGSGLMPCSVICAGAPSAIGQIIIIIIVLGRFSTQGCPSAIQVAPVSRVDTCHTSGSQPPVS